MKGNWKHKGKTKNKKKGNAVLQKYREAVDVFLKSKGGSEETEKRGRDNRTDRGLSTYWYGSCTKSGMKVFGIWTEPEEKDVRREGSKRDEKEVWRQVWVWVETWMEGKLGWRPLSRSTWTLPEQSAIRSLEREPFTPLSKFTRGL